MDINTVLSAIDLFLVIGIAVFCIPLIVVGNGARDIARFMLVASCLLMWGAFEALFLDPGITQHIRREILAITLLATIWRASGKKKHE